MYCLSFRGWKLQDQDGGRMGGGRLWETLPWPLSSFCLLVSNLTPFFQLTAFHADVPLSLSANLFLCKDCIHISSIIILSANTAIFKVLLSRLLWATAKLITALTQSWNQLAFWGGCIHSTGLPEQITTDSVA